MCILSYTPPPNEKKTTRKKETQNTKTKGNKKTKINLDEIVIITSVKSTNVYSVTSEPKHGNDCF